MTNLKQIVKNRHKHGDESVYLCSSCEEKVSGLAVSEDTDSYEVEEIGVSI